MQLEQVFSLAPAPEQVWPTFKNIDLLVECLPGASLTGPAVDGEVPLRFDVKLGPIAAGFVGSGKVAFDDATRSGRFEGQATDRRTGSRIRGAAAFVLLPANDKPGTQVNVTVDYTLTGALAQFNRPAIVRDLASALTAQFASQLAARLAVAPSAVAVAGAPAISNPALASGSAHGDPVIDSVLPEAASTPRPAVPLDAWTLVKHLVRMRWNRLLGRNAEGASS
ncbi:MAG: SRPBCC family protein [Burkholderiaceae bacterium]